MGRNAKLYVDFENVQSAGLKNIRDLRQGDTVNIVYSKKAERICISEIRELMETPADIVFTEAETGTPNALDFQLLALMLLDCKDSPCEYIVISRDTGYDPAIKMARARGIERVYRFRDITEFAATRAKAEEKEVKEEVPGIGQQAEMRVAVEDEETWPDIDGPEDLSFETAEPDSSSGEEPQAAMPYPEEPETEGEVIAVVPDRTPETEPDWCPEEFVMSGAEEDYSDAEDTEDPSESSPAAEKDGCLTEVPRVTGKKKRVRIRNYLRKKGIELTAEQSAMVAAAINETETKKQFYQYFQKKMGKKGIAFYNELRNEYSVIKAI